MRAYSDALHIEPGADEKRIALARDLVTKCLGVVLISDVLALRAEPSGILCEVIDPHHGAHGSKARYEALIANAKAALEASPLASAVASERLQWLVVDDYGMGTRQLWPVV
jgi:hypothetical protein